MTVIKYMIPNISCGHCVHTIKNELGELDGVKAVEGNPAAKEIVVTFDAPASVEAIENLLVEINYPPQK